MSPDRRRWLQRLADSALAAQRWDVRLLGVRRFGMRVVVVETDPQITGYATLETPPPDTPPGLDIGIVSARHLSRVLQATA